MKEKIVLKYKKENDLSEQKLTLNDRVDNIFKSGWVNEITYLSNLMQDTRVCLVELQQENKQLKEDIKELFKENENKEKVIILQDNIIKEARKYINNASYFDGSSMCANDLLEILDGKDKELKKLD